MLLSFVYFCFFKLIALKNVFWFFMSPTIVVLQSIASNLCQTQQQSCISSLTSIDLLSHCHPVQLSKYGVHCLFYFSIRQIQIFLWGLLLNKLSLFFRCQSFILDAASVIWVRFKKQTTFWQKMLRLIFRNFFIKRQIGFLLKLQNL